MPGRAFDKERARALFAGARGSRERLRRRRGCLPGISFGAGNVIMQRFFYEGSKNKNLLLYYGYRRGSVFFI